MNAEDLLRNAHSAIRELLDKAWELGGYSVGEREFNGYSFVKDARSSLKEIDRYFMLQIKEKEEMHNQVLTLRDLVEQEKKHWLESDKPKVHLYHLYKEFFRTKLLEYERKYKEPI